MSSTPAAASLLEVRDLSVEFRTEDGVVSAVNGISYEVKRRETLAILGESGSGKTVGAQAVMGILDIPPAAITGGQVLFEGQDLLSLSESERRELRGERIAMIFQDALTALNPVFTIGFQIAEQFRIRRGLSRAESRKHAAEWLDRVRIPDAKDRLDAYPHELSGGMRQRAMIAMTLALDPDLVIADEPTTALDVTVQAQIMALLEDLKNDLGMGLILITHDLGVVAEVADRVAVMYAGRIVEHGTTSDVYHRSRHPYTLGLTASIPRADVAARHLDPIPGAPPDLMHIPSGCAFHPRCGFAKERCERELPELVRKGSQLAACHFSDELPTAVAAMPHG